MSAPYNPAMGGPPPNYPGSLPPGAPPPGMAPGVYSPLISNSNQPPPNYVSVAAPPGAPQPGAPPVGSGAYGAQPPMGGVQTTIPGQVPSVGPPDANVNPESLAEANENAKESEASAPPVSEMPTIQGFAPEALANDTYIAPPPYAPPEFVRAPVHFNASVAISEAEAREAFINEVNQRCCYGTGAAKKATFTKMQPSDSFHYSLETYTEARRADWVHEPYRGTPIDGPQNGPAPGPWDIYSVPDTMFVNQTKFFEVPHTAYVRQCHTCHGSTMVRCSRCCGAGRTRCTWCHGRGHQVHHRTDQNGHRHTHHSTCTSCMGMGHVRCVRCSGCGKVTCPTCSGTGSLKFYIKLTVQYTNQTSDHVTERTDLPDNLIKNAGGTIIFQETYPLVVPLTTFVDADVNKGSMELVSKHATQFSSMRTLQQRQTLRQVPVLEVDYSFNNKPHRTFVYGLDRRVWFDEYPQSCCWGCTIL
eukprot:Colp12_sorted_trinity150504_noHs@9960